MKNIRIETYKWEDVLDAIPFSMRDCVSISFEWYGYVHDTGFHTIIGSPCDGHPITNLEEAKATFEENAKKASQMWRIASDYAYH